MLTRANIETIDAFLDYINHLDTAPMLIYQNKTFSYAEIHRYIFTVSHWLNVQNIQKIMFSISNSPLSVSLFMASWQLKIEVIPVNPRFIANELLNLAQKVEPDMLVLELQQSSNEMITFCQTHQIKLITIDEPITYLEGLKSERFNMANHLSSKNNESITYHISSGTDGHYHFHGHYTSQILHYAYARQFDYGLIKGDMSLVHLSFNHAYAFSYQLLPNIAIGNCMILAPAFDPKTSLKLIQKYQVTALALLPTMYHQLAQKVQKKPLKHQLRHLSVAGDQPSEALMQLVKDAFNTPLLNGLGMTEVYGYAQNLTESEVYNKLRIFSDVQVKIEAFQSETVAWANNSPKHVGVSNQCHTHTDNSHLVIGGNIVTTSLTVEQNHIGEIYIKTPMQPISHQDRWLATGDYGYLDDEHNLYFLGRIKDIIVKGGSKISPLELEHYLYKMPQIKQVAILGKKDPLWGEIVCMCATTNNDISLTLDEVNTFLKPFLASYKHIDKIFLYSELPLNITEKIDKFRLKQEIENA